MRLKRYFLGFFALACISPAVMAQKDIRQQLRKGNKAYNDSIYRDAEIAYRKAIDASPKEERSMAHYNLGNTLLLQSKADEALKEYEKAAAGNKNDAELAEIYHNMGVAHQGKNEFEKAIESYKKSLIKNPKDDETRYNLALLLGEQEQQEQDKKDDKKEDKKDDQKEKQDKQDQKQDQQKDQQKDKQDKQQEQQPNEPEMSKDTAEQLLESVLRDEKKTQEKVQKQMMLRNKNKLEKEW